MAHSTTWEKYGVYWQLSGIVSVNEYFATNAELYNDSRSDQIRY